MLRDLDPGYDRLGSRPCENSNARAAVMNFSRFSPFSAFTGSAKRKNSLQMRHFQTISEFSHSLGHQLNEAQPTQRSAFH